MTTNKLARIIAKAKTLLAPALALLLAVAAHAATPGITSTAGTPATFNLTAQDNYLNQPDGSAVYSWGYGCVQGSAPSFVPAAISGAFCPTMQVPGPTLVVTEGQTVTVTLTNNLPTAAGNTSILFPGFQVTTSGGVQGLLAQEALPGGSVTYTFVASTPGTHAYYSGTQGDLQVEMGLYGAVVVIPKNIPANCTTGLAAQDQTVKKYWGEPDFRLAPAAFDHAKSCYDREYLFQWAEMDPRIHRQAQAQISDPKRAAACATGFNTPGCSLEVATEPYHPTYFLINGRSMPDLMDANYESEYPHQPYNADPHTHPGELLLIRTVGQGRWQHPFHEHANHVRILARDGNLILSESSDQDLAGILMFNTDTTPGDAFDGIFYFTGRGLNWDPYGHHAPLPGTTAGTAAADPFGDTLATLPCYPDANGYNTGLDPVSGSLTHPEVLHAVNYYEWCQDHYKPLEAAPFGDVDGNGPATLPNPNIFTNGAWYGGTPYLGPDATLRSGSTLRVEGTAPYSQGSAGCATGLTVATGQSTEPGCTLLQPSNLQANPANERGWAYMWHSHNEREITTNNVFPGGMLMMLLVDSREFVIDETL